MKRNLRSGDSVFFAEPAQLVDRVHETVNDAPEPGSFGSMSMTSLPCEASFSAIDKPIAGSLQGIMKRVPAPVDRDTDLESGLRVIAGEGREDFAQIGNGGFESDGFDPLRRRAMISRNSDG